MFHCNLIDINNMRTNKIIAFVAVTAGCLALSAQTTFDAAKLYEEELNGTARYVGMGGAMSALGSDPSVISHNPAGIGTYRKSDINTSLSFFGSSVSMDPAYTINNKGIADDLYYYSSNSKSDLNMALDNLSFIFSGYDGDDTYMNLGFSYRRLQDMDRTLDYLDKFYVDYDGDGQLDDVRYREYLDHQRNKINSFDFNLSWSLSEILYMGCTFGILSTDTWSEGHFYDYLPAYNKVEQEDKYLLNPSAELVDSTSVDKMNTANGSGWNMGFGVIIRPIPALRLGVSVKTPTIYKQKLDYADELYALRGKPINEELTSSVDYKFSSPWSLDLSAGLTFGAGNVNCALGAEYEKFFTQRSSLSIGNTKIQTQGAIDFKDYSSFKTGLELNISNLSIRGGYNLIESMFNDNSGMYLDDTDFNVDRMDWQLDRLGKRQYFTAGLGYCSSPDRDGTQFYFDLAYVHGVRNSLFNTCEYIEDIDVNYNYKTDKVLFTVGWNF